MSYDGSKKFRQQWFASLTDEEKNAYIRKKEKGKEEKLKQLPKLTQEQIKQINQNMVDIGMEEFIVLREEGEILY